MPLLIIVNCITIVLRSIVTIVAIVICKALINRLIIINHVHISHVYIGTRNYVHVYVSPHIAVRAR